MVSIHNINNGINDISDRYHDCNGHRLLILGGYHKVNLLFRLMKYIDTRIILHVHEGPWMAK
jgi:hypothetical protein